MIHIIILFISGLFCFFNLKFYNKEINFYEVILQVIIPQLLCFGIYELNNYNKGQDKEYWSDKIHKIVHDTEYQSYEYNSCCTTYSCNCTTDKDGNTSCDTCCDGCWECNDYPEKYYKVGDNKYYISRSEFYQIAKKFNTQIEDKGEYTDVNFGGWDCGYNGKRYVYNYDGDIMKTVNAVTEHKYENKVRYSNSLYSPIKITKNQIKQYNLLNYPKIINETQDYIIGYNYKGYKKHNQLLENYNANNGKNQQIFLRYFVFNNKSSDIGFYQKHYLENGNKNELNIIFSLNDSLYVQWVELATWTESSNLIVGIENLVNIPIDSFNQEVLKLTKEHWVRKEFTSLNSLVDLKPSITFLMILISLSILFNIGLSILFVKNNW